MCDPSQASPDSTITAVQPPAANTTAMRLAVVIAECTAMCEAEWWLDTVWFETVEHCLARTCIGGLHAPNSQADANAGPEDTAHLQDTAGNTPSATAAIGTSPAASTTLVIDKSAWNASSSMHPNANSETADHDTAEAEAGLESAPPASVEASAAEPEPAATTTTTTTTKVISERERKKLARQRHHNQATTSPTASDVAAGTTRTSHQKTTSPPPTEAVEPPAPVADEDTAQVVAPKLTGHGATTDGVGRMVKKKSMG